MTDNAAHNKAAQQNSHRGSYAPASVGETLLSPSVTFGTILPAHRVSSRPICDMPQMRHEMGEREVRGISKLKPAHGSYIHSILYLWAVATYLATARAIPSLVRASIRTAVEAEYSIKRGVLPAQTRYING